MKKLLVYLMALMLVLSVSLVSCGVEEVEENESDTKENMDLAVHAVEYGNFALKTAIAVKNADNTARVAAGSIAHPAQNM